ncbi:TIGR00730 family Rossman fold protein [Pollutimonas subterranea]|uniref:Cytokinin riboside 5'-monophosphate phosphoribohydrolase n=1 Tax=Pollutimonas subterranea TaxID=2045210 RepID=A0A2N4U287_9BURK|nr:TIGR00730 family Rossman fold protein [Pollutimonas subterranea]PLC49131.1 TIGR00730 family Rossman fold protein [Pollutimonas subterranea]
MKTAFPDAERRHILQEAIQQGQAYTLAQEDIAFLASEDLRPVRMQLELLKTEHALREHGVNATIVVFGSARILSPEDARAALALVKEQSDVQPDDPGLQRALALATRRVAQSHWYDEAYSFARKASQCFEHEGPCDLVVMTGGGPGIMEAANRGAFEAGERSVGLNITLPHEQYPNPFITPELAFRFHYFALRKMHFLLRAKALVAFPGGFGTLDELFEVLTLVQTRKMGRIPIVLVDSAFWKRLVNFDFLVEEGMIAPEDLQLFVMVNSAEEAVDALREFYAMTPP